MKKVYTKPVLVMENFSLSQSVCHNCGKNLDFQQATLKTKETCGWDLGIDGFYEKGGQDIIWANGNSCSMLTDEIVTGAGVCYNNPDGGFNIFNS